MRRLGVLLPVSLALISYPLNAQQRELSKGKVGLTFPTTGIIWHFSDRVALLTSAGYSYSWYDYSSNPATASSGSLGAGAGLRIYAREWKGVHLFLSPKYTFSRLSGSSDPVFSTGSTLTSSVLGHEIRGAWGLQYPISDRVSILGEYGIYFSRSVSSNSPPATTGDRRSYNVGSYGSWGLILYLK
jgi:hypothetical protein